MTNIDFFACENQVDNLPLVLQLLSHIYKRGFLLLSSLGCNSNDKQSKILFSQFIVFSVVFREFQFLIYSLICQTITLSVSSCLYTFVQWILLFCQFIGFYFIQLLQLVSLFYLFVVVFWLSKHSRHRLRLEHQRTNLYGLSFYIFSR